MLDPYNSYSVIMFGALSSTQKSVNLDFNPWLFVEYYVTDIIVVM